MDFEIIESKDNKLIKSVRKLVSSAQDRKSEKLFVLEGLRLCNDAALNGYTLETLLISQNFKDVDKISKLMSLAKRRVMVPDALFKSLCDTVNPQGVLCVAKIPHTVSSIDEVNGGKYIMLENTADPANLGTIARTAEALGIKGLIISSKGTDPFSPKSQRAGMGALLRLPIYLSDDILTDISTLKNRGFTVFSSVVYSDAESLLRVTFPENSVVLIGNEANGLTSEAVTLSDRKVTIKMAGRAESLNAAAAAAIFMWQMTGGNE